MEYPFKYVHKIFRKARNSYPQTLTPLDDCRHGNIWILTPWCAHFWMIADMSIFAAFWKTMTSAKIQVYENVYSVSSHRWQSQAKIQTKIFRGWYGGIQDAVLRCLKNPTSNNLKQLWSTANVKKGACQNN